MKLNFKLNLKLKKAFFVFSFLFILSPLFAQARGGAATNFYDAGRRLQSQRQFALAIEQYQQALAINPAYGDCWFALAECSYETEQYKLAVMYLDKAATYQKENSKIQNLKGFALINLGEYAEARLQFQSVLAKYPNDVDARFGLAELDLFDGKLSGAEKWYEDALKRQGSNRKALLSLALISYELGKKDATKKYIELAEEYHSGSAEVFYFSAYLQMLENNLRVAEGKARSSISLNPDYDAGYEILSIILYRAGRYEEVCNICDTRIAKNRDAYTAWYMKAIAKEALGKTEEALTAFAGGLEVVPQDELMRSAMEALVCANLQVEDERRKSWSAYHVKNANTQVERFYSESAKYEFRRALRINPFDNVARKKYAELMLQEGYPELYLSQLEFINKTDKTRDIAESIESYKSLLRGSLATRWSVETLYLEKNRQKIGLYPFAKFPQLLHPEAERVTCQMLSDYFTASSYFKVDVESTPTTYAKAFSNARKQSQDYFALVSVEESEREISLTLNLYSGRTGNECGAFRIYRTGNGRYSTAVQKLAQAVSESFPVRGKIIAREADKLLLDVGTLDSVQKGDVFTIVRKGRVNTADSTTEVEYRTDDVFGYVTITTAGEEISQGTFERKGFYDKINEGDEVVLTKRASSEGEFTKPETTFAEDFDISSQAPILVELIRKISN